MELYEGRDDNKWSPTINVKLFKMWRCTPSGIAVNMMKMNVTMRASLRAVIDTTTDYVRRVNWDTNLYDFRVLY